MKFTTASFFATALIATSLHAIPVQTLVRQIPAPIENVFVPQGFDSNDNAEVVISGVFPNSCYKMGKTTHRFSEQEKKIYIDVTAYHSDSDYCLAMNIPFLQVVQLGTLDMGRYPIVVNNVIDSSIPVAAAKTSEDGSDNFLYASVYGLIQRDTTSFDIQGVSPNGCYEVSDIKVLRESEKVVTVLPIMQKIENCDEAANAKPVAWIKSFSVPSQLKGKVLIHVRTLNGGSINQVVSL